MSTFQTQPGHFLRSLTAEALGTFFLLLAGLLAPANLAFVAVGLTLLVLVVAIGKVSGSHVNPAVTLALVAARKFKPLDGLFYFAAQLVGAFLAVLVVRSLGRPLPTIEAGSNAFWFELLGAFLLAFVVAQVVVKNVPEAGSALAIGGALALGVLIAGGASGGVLNPALGGALLSSGAIIRGGAGVYLLAPLIAGALAGLLGGFLGTGEAPDEPA